MPQASAGFSISSNAQVGADVIKTGNILDGEIVNADIGAAAAIAGSKIQALSVGANAGVIPSTGIIDAHIAAGAAIVDTKLATISTAGKVSGAALTLLTNIPAGAGIIPGANVPAKPTKSMLISRDLTATGWAVTTAHGLGATPTYVRAYAMLYYGATSKAITCIGTYDGSLQQCIFSGDAAAAATIGDNTIFLKIWGPVGVNTYQSAVISVDGTNITLTWTKNGSPSGIAQIIIEAQ